MSRCKFPVCFAFLAAAGFAGADAPGDDGPTRVELKRRELPQIKHGNGFRSMYISYDGKLLLTASEDNTARLFDTETGKPVGQPMRHNAMVKEAVISRDGKVVATAGGDGVARLWEARTGKKIGSDMRHVGPVNAIALSADGKYVLTGGQDRTARLWYAKTGAAVGPIVNHQNVLARVAFMPDGRSILTASWDRTVRKWELTTGKALGLACSESLGATSLDFSRDGRLLITCSRDAGVRLWDVLTGKPLSAEVATETHFGDIALSPDASVFLTSGTIERGARPEGQSSVRVWDTETLKPVGKPFVGKSALAFDPTGKIIAVGGDDGVVEIWEIQIHQAKAKPAGPESLEGSWKALAGDDAVGAYRASSALIRTPELALPFLEQRLKPAAPADDKLVRKLIEQLDDESFEVREKAERQLAASRRKWEAQLKAALAKDPPDEARQRIQRVLESPEDTSPLPDRLREQRAVQVLEAIDNNEARRLLRTLAGGAADAELTREARAALDRLTNP
jgi:WD40 repeat protein